MKEPRDAVEPGPAEKLPRKIYERELARLHEELVLLQKWVVEAGRKVCLVFEGRDGAGKGGAIKAITQRVSPRVFHIVALPAPTEREKSQMYFQRYMPHLPAAGEITIFDRSWYNRAGVERVMGFCTEEQAKRFLEIVPELEHLVVESDTILLKYWLEVSPDEQSRRLKERITDGRKTWKLSPMDLESYGRWDDYTHARDEMFRASDSKWAPWYVVRSDDKRRARLNLIRHLLDHIPYDRKPGKKVKLPARQSRGDYKAPDYPFKFIPEHDWTANDR
jgi:polyphosphate kinase